MSRLRTPPHRRLPLPVLGLLLALGACTPASPASGPLQLTDDAGRVVTLADVPRRIVSLAPSNTEIVCAIGACDRLVGVTDADDYPAEVLDLPEVVIFAQVDVEAVVAADPDLVLAAGNELTPSAVIGQLSDLGLPVLVIYPDSLDDLYDGIELIGRAVDRAPAAADVVAAMRARVAAVVTALAGVEPPRTFYEVAVYEGAIYTAGEDSFLASLVSLAGGAPITGDPASTAIQLEDLVEADPELILLGDAAYDPSVTPASVAQRTGWGDMTAVISGRILVMLADPVITRPGPRIVDGLEALARAIHPARFTN